MWPMPLWQPATEKSKPTRRRRRSVEYPVNIKRCVDPKQFSLCNAKPINFERIFSNPSAFDNILGMMPEPSLAVTKPTPTETFVSAPNGIVTPTEFQNEDVGAYLQSNNFKRYELFLLILHYFPLHM